MDINALKAVVRSHNKKIVLEQVGECIQCISHYRDKDGYSIASVNRKPTGLHRLVYGWVKGVIPIRMLVRHSCDNPSCVNPDHLLLGTHQDNKNDAVKRKRIAVRTNNGNAKLSEKQVRRIKASPLSQQKLADKYGVHKQTIGHIKRGLSWNGSES